MLFTDYELPQTLDRINYALNQYAKVKLLVKFIKNSTLIGRFTFWQFKAKFYSNNKFYNGLYMMGREVSSPIIFDPPLLTLFPF